MSTLRRISVAVFLVGTTLASGGCKKTCSEGGEDHGDGTSWQCADGCNSCTCTDGVVSSTLVACGVVDAGLTLPDAGEPSEDASEPAGEVDGAASTDASASADASTSPDASAPRGCGARLGDTCTEDEYCAYAPGQLCGQADATATCKPRPEVCADIHAPVCGCDGDSYGNTCEAARAGTGVHKKGECPN